MRKIWFLIFAIILSGCATYKFSLGQPPYENGYVVTRDYKLIPEYTVGKDNSPAADLALAKERFKRRRKTVKFYYRKMDIIENSFARLFWTPLIILGKTVWGVFRLPAIAISDYRYENNPQYRDMVRRRDEEQWAWEKARIDELKNKLTIYINNELEKENK